MLPRLLSGVALVCFIVSAATSGAQHPTSRLSSPPPLPRLAGVRGFSISGLSSGADMAVQFAVAYSDVVAGAGVFAGQAYRCAVTRFAGDSLSREFNPSVPFCDGCPPNETIGYDHCKRHPEVQNVTKLVEYAAEQMAAGTIASRQDLAGLRVLLYRGTRDTTYNKGAVQAAADFFSAFLPRGAVKFVNYVQSAHLVPGIDPYLCWWEEWSGPDNCTFDGAGEVLRWVHGADRLSAPRNNNTQHLYENYLMEFDQRLYAAKSSLFAATGRVFVPPDCASAAAKCTVHFFLHGCGVAWTFETFSQFSGFNEWAYANSIIVVYPRIANVTVGTSQQRSGCFDGYGQTGRDYTLRSGVQLKALYSMMQAFQP